MTANSSVETIHLNIQDSFRVLRSELNFAVRHLLMAHGSVALLSVLPRGVPGVLHQVTPVYPDGWSIDVEREAFTAWAFTNTIKDSIEAMKIAFEAVRQYCEVFRLIGPGVKISPNELLIRVREKSRRFTSLGLPKQLEWLRKEYDVAADGEETEMLLSLNAVRNCLVHRRGIVSQEYDAGRSGLLIAMWWALHACYKAEDDSLVWVEKAGPLPENTALLVAPRRFQREFKVGEHISFSIQECYFIFMFFERYAFSLHQSVVSFAQSQGGTMLPER